MSVSTCQCQFTAGNGRGASITWISSAIRVPSRRAQLVDEADQPVAGGFELGVRYRERKANPAIIAERATRNQRHAFLLHHLLAELRPAEAAVRGEPVDAKEEVEGPVRLDELDPRQLVVEARDEIVTPATERPHHPRHFDFGIAERFRGSPHRGLVGAGGHVALQRRHGAGEFQRSVRCANTPPGHGVRLGGAVEHHAALEHAIVEVEQRRRGTGTIMN